MNLISSLHNSILQFYTAPPAADKRDNTTLMGAGLPLVKVLGSAALMMTCIKLDLRWPLVTTLSTLATIMLGHLISNRISHNLQRQSEKIFFTDSTDDTQENLGLAEEYWWDRYDLENHTETLTPPYSSRDL